MDELFLRLLPLMSDVEQLGISESSLQLFLELVDVERDFRRASLALHCSSERRPKTRSYYLADTKSMKTIKCSIRSIHHQGFIKRNGISKSIRRYLHSSFIPTSRHRLSLHAWHFLRIHMSISHWPPNLHTYVAALVILRRKKPVTPESAIIHYMHNADITHTHTHTQSYNVYHIYV